jgi:hypothetical protein
MLWENSTRANSRFESIGTWYPFLPDVDRSTRYICHQGYASEHTIAKERRITYSTIMAQLPRASLMHALAAA